MDQLTRLLLERQAEYEKSEQVSICLLTWNINGILPPDIDTICDNLLPQMPAQVIAVGLQELAVADQGFGMQEQICNEMFERWKSTLLFAINYKYQSNEYRLVSKVRMSGIGMMVFSSINCEAVSSGQAACGVFGVWGNKGAVAVKLLVHDSVVVLVCAHLAAHLEYWGKRNQDYSFIRSRMVLDGSIKSKDNIESSEERTLAKIRHYKTASGSTMDDAEFVFWFGDLNYRLTEPDQSRVLKLIDCGDYEQLTRQDQLKLSMFMKTAFTDYMEPQITFPPTFKFNKQGEYNALRCPAWCDRVLWRADDRIVSLLYDSPNVLLSDHKPVLAVALLPVQSVDTNAFSAVYKQVQSHMDSLENEQIPQTMVTVVDTDTEGVIVVGKCFIYNTMIKREVIIKNQGPTSAEFVIRGEQEWIRVSQQSGIILPHSQQILHVMVHVNSISARHLNTLPQDFSTVLIIHIVNGRDHFVSVEGEYVKSHFGELVPDDTLPDTLSLLGSFIKQHDGAKNMYMLVESAEAGLVQELIEAIDSNRGIDVKFGVGDNILAVGECLLLYLYSAPTPLIGNEAVVTYLTDLFADTNHDSIYRALRQQEPSLFVN